jgi:hypothetical protein
MSVSAKINHLRWTGKNPRVPGNLLMLYLLCAFGAVYVYLFGLESQYIPKNGDEYVYARVTRLTAQSQHLLPPSAETEGMGNTKPPLLFWQGLISTRWGQAWTLARLRWPNMLYTLFTAVLIGLSAWKITGAAAGADGGGRGNLETGLTAALAYLAFFSTYRYGRPFLTNSPEVFWVTACFFPVLWRALTPRLDLISWPLTGFFGFAAGMVLLYKSFALLVPIEFALLWWCLHRRQYRWHDVVRRDLLRLVCLAVIALFIFAFWFMLSADPQAIWREFVIGENAGKFTSPGSDYLSKLLWGSSSIWNLALGYAQNALFLAAPVLSLFVIAWRRRSHLTEGERLLWILIVVWFAVFCVPSQRSSRYLLDAMPALAVVLALQWKNIPRWAFVTTHVLVLLFLSAFGWLSLLLVDSLEEASRVPQPAYGPAWWLLLGATAWVSLQGCFSPRTTRTTANVAILLCYLVFARFIHPLDGPLGHFRPETVALLRNKQIGVPYAFNAGDEGHRFILIGADIVGYRGDSGFSTADLAARYPFFTVTVPVEQTALTCRGCTVVDQRLYLHGRHSSEEIRDMLHGDVFRHLFVRELLVRGPLGLKD